MTPGACLQGTGAHLTVPLLATCDRVLYHETLTGGVGAEELLGFFQRAAALLVNSDIEWIQWDNAPNHSQEIAVRRGEFPGFGLAVWMGGLVWVSGSPLLWRFVRVLALLQPPLLLHAGTLQDFVGTLRNRHGRPIQIISQPSYCPCERRGRPAGCMARTRRPLAFPALCALSRPRRPAPFPTRSLEPL